MRFMMLGAGLALLLACGCGGSGSPIADGGENTPPVIEDVNRSIDVDQPIEVTLTGSDPDGDALTFAIVDAPTLGTLDGTPPELTYTPPTGVAGTDQFTYRANDGQEDSNLGTYTIEIGGENSEPTADDQAVMTDEDVPVSITLTGDDPEGDDLSFVIVDLPERGTLDGTPPEVTYTPDSGFDGVDTFTFRVNDGEFDSSLATVTVTISGDNDAPTGADDEYDTLCNTLLEVGIDASTRPKVGVTGSVLDNDEDPELGPLTVTGTSGVGPGVVLVMNADGTFSYLPGVFSTGSQTFQYTVSDGSQTDTATVTINLGQCAWFVDNAVSGGANDGRSESPFESLATFNASLNPQAGHLVYIHEGTGAYTGPLQAKDSMMIVGAGTTFDVGPLEIPAGSAPTITDTVGANALDIGSNTTFMGFDLEASFNAAVSGASKGGNTTFSGVNVSVSGAGRAVQLTGLTGSFGFATGAISGTTTASGITIANTSATMAFDGSVSLSTETSAAVSLTNNTGGLVRFSGGLSLTTSSGEALVATGGGELEVTGSNNAIDTLTGRALRMQDTGIGAGGLTFESISSDGAPNGISLQNTGSVGGLTVTGDGSLMNNGSGGTIQNTTSDAVYLFDTFNVSLTSMNITAPAQEGIDARRLRGAGNLFRAGTISGVSGGSEAIFLDNDDTDLGLLELNNALVLGVDGSGDDGLWVRGRGSSVMRVDVTNGTHFDGLRDYAIYVQSRDTASVVLNVLDARFSNDSGSSTGDSSIYFYSAEDAALRTVIESSTFDGVLDGLNYDINGSSSLVGRLLENDIDGVVSGQALYLRSEHSVSSVDFIVDGNNIDDTSGDGVVFELYDAATIGNLSITNNLIGTILPVNEHGIRVTLRSDRTGSYGDLPIVANLLIDGNTIFTTDTTSESVDLDCQVDHPNGSTANPAATLNATVTNNTITNLNNLGGEEVEVDSEYGPNIGQPAGPSRICLDMQANTLENGSGIVDDLDEATGTLLDAILDVVQTSLANFASANGIFVGNVDVQGAPNFGAVASCPLPTHAP